MCSRFGSAAAIAALVAALVATPAASAGAQEWNDARTTDLVRRAVARRQVSDTSLVDYRARAHGYLSFLAQLGDTLVEPPKLVKTDELMVDVYWKSPSFGKQVIVGRRDTMLVPGDIGYYSDRYGIVQSNFPDRIRMGDGQDVRDVPHPVSTAMGEYEYRIRDSLALQIPGRRVEVYEVDVRPRDETQPRVVGSLFLERTTGDIVRMSLTFTRAAILDRRIEVLAVTLDNALIDERFWLPRHQELEVRRAGTWFDFPARGIIRARWDVTGHEVNRGLAMSLFAGPPIVSANLDSVRRFPFPGQVLDRLPDNVLPVAPEDVARVTAVATELITRRALAKAQGSAVAASGVSDFIRVNRVEGMALGIGARFRPTAGVGIAVRARYGFGDADLKGGVAIDVAARGNMSVSLFAERTFRDVGDDAEVSLLRNSIAAQEFGADLTDPYDVRQAGVALSLGAPGSTHWRIEVAAGSERALGVHASPSTGRYAPTIPAAAVDGVHLAVTADRAITPSFTEGSLRLHGELRLGSYEPVGLGDARSVARFAGSATYTRPFAMWTLVTHTTLAIVASDRPVLPQHLVYLGGPVSGPGYDFHEFVGQVGASQRIEARFAVPFFGIPLGRYGRVPPSATLAPFVHAVAIGDVPAGAPRGGAVYPAAGVGLLLIHELLRIDVARGLRDGRWTFAVDVARAFWGVL